MGERGVGYYAIDAGAAVPLARLVAPCAVVEEDVEEDVEEAEAKEDGRGRALEQDEPSARCCPGECSGRVAAPVVGEYEATLVDRDVCGPHKYYFLQVLRDERRPE
eukprot:3347608-Prymnesium_polylepis.1